MQRKLSQEPEARILTCEKPVYFSFFSHLPVLLEAFSSIANYPMALLHLQTPKAGPVGGIK